MPVYQYKCEKCTKSFERYYPTFTSAEPFIDGCEHDCGGKAIRVLTPAKVFFAPGYHESAMYSDPSNPDKQ